MSPVESSGDVRSPQSAAASRLRIFFEKSGPLIFISHLDLARVWERVFRRARLPVVYSQGYNPRPKIQFASGLPLGYASEHEILDVWLSTHDFTLDDLRVRLQNSVPEGLGLMEIHEVGLSEPALQTRIRSATYRVVVGNLAGREPLAERVKIVLAADSIIRNRRDKIYDLRTLIDNLILLPGEPLTLEFTLSLDPGRGTGRADEVLSALEIDPLAVTIVRTLIQLED